ncbi:MAG TPA: HYR domain-containing protein [Bacteroidetes bacterium]|nr:HYR domain-containing protein [Bacteroidota bacterium]
MKHCTYNYGVAFAFILCMLARLDGWSQCTLACNDQVQVSIDQSGFAIITPDMVLEGEETNCPGPKSVEVQLPDGSTIGDTVTCEQVGGLFSTKVIDDATGNFCWGSILVEDKLRPTIICQNDTVNCTASLTPAAIGLPAIADNCDSNPLIEHLDEVNLQSCNTPYTAILTRTWHATDASGNAAFPCVQDIYVVRPSLADVEFPLDLDNVALPALSCSDPDTSVARTGMPMVDSVFVGSLCKINVSHQDQVVEDCGNTFSVLRQWLVLDCCSGEILTHSQLIKVEDIQPPVFTCPDTLTFSANSNECEGIFMLPALPVSDVCSNEITVRTIAPNGMTESNGGLVVGLPMGVHTVRYEALDACGNLGICEATLIVQDDIVPVAVCDEITQVAVGSNGLANVPAEVFDDGSYDACCDVSFSVKRMDEPNAPFLPEATLTCDDIGDTTTVIVQVTDCRGNSNTCMVSVLTEDKLPPEITCPDDVTLACTEWLLGAVPPAETGEPEVVENCGIDTIVFTDVENLNICHTGMVTRTFTVTDISGFSASCSQKITLIDTTGSTFQFPPDTVFTDCSQPIDSISAGEAIAFSDCEAWALNISDEIFPIECGLKIFRTYTFLEWCTHEDTSFTQYIEVRDTNPPVWDQPFGSKDTMYVCPGDLVKPGPPTATDYCTPAEVVLVGDTIVFNGCANRFTRTFTYIAMDTCGNVAEPFFTRIFVNDTVPPSADLPDRGPFNCVADIPPFDPDSLDVADNCPTDVFIELIGETTVSNDCVDTLIRTYRFTDICGLVTEASQTFLVMDTLPPVADLPVQGPFPCLEFVPAPAPGEVVATDNCGGFVTVEWVGDSTNVEGCTGLLWRTFRLTDECGNNTLATQIFTILDNEPPSLNCPGEVNVPITSETCEVEITITVSATDNCGGDVTITNSYGNEGNRANGTFGLGTTLVTFYAEDECGNVDSCQVPVNVTELVTPSNECNFFVVELDENGVAAIDLDSLLKDGLVGGEDFCTPVTFSIDPDTLDCVDYVANLNPALGIAVITYTLTVTDTFGNASNCSNTIFLADPLDICDDDGLVVGGLVFDENRQPLANVETQLIDGGDMVYSMTSEEGWYNFPDVAAGATCLLKPYKNDDLRNGVSTYDLIKISKHILGEEPLGSPYKIIAADANASGGVTTYDLALIRKAILYVSDEFPNNTSWRFVHAGYEFPDPQNPFEEDFPESIWINGMSRDVYGNDFIAIKIGDVNGSASLGFTGGGVEDRVGAAFPVAANDKVLEKGERAAIPIFAESEIDLSAFQATFQFDEEKMSFEGFGTAALDIGEHNYAQPKSGSVTLSWDTPEGHMVEANEILAILYFQIHEVTSVSKAFKLNSTLTPAIVFEDGGNPLNVIWRTREVSHMPAGAADFFQLKQNRPNPFGNETQVLFWLKEPMPARLEIFDLAGRKTTVLDAEMDAGWNEVTLRREDFGSSGIYFYQLITPYGAERRKMVVE